MSSPGLARQANETPTVGAKPDRSPSSPSPRRSTGKGFAIPSLVRCRGAASESVPRPKRSNPNGDIRPALMLAVAVRAHALTTGLAAEAACFRELRAKPLPATHVAGGDSWRNGRSRLLTVGFSSSFQVVTALSTASCHTGVGFGLPLLHRQPQVVAVLIGCAALQAAAAEPDLGRNADIGFAESRHH